MEKYADLLSGLDEETQERIIAYLKEKELQNEDQRF